MGELDTNARSILNRVKAILFDPKREWPIIDNELTTNADLFMRYAVPLAAIAPVCSFLHGQIFGYGAFGFSWHPSLIGGLASMVTSYVVSLVGLFLLGLIAEFLAPKFAGVANKQAALKLVVYGATASFVAGLANLLPGLGILGLAGLYSFYLFYTGAMPLMKVPADKAMAFTAVTFVCAIVLAIVVGAVVSPVARLFGGPSSTLASNDTTQAGKLNLPGGGSLDLQQMKQASEQLQRSANGSGKKPVAFAQLQELLPSSVAGYQRTAVEGAAMGTMGSTATGTYTSGGNSFELKITDMAAMGAIAGLGTAMGVEDSKQDADGYDKTGTVDGHLQSEAWHKSSHSGKFSIILASRYAIEASGSAGSIDDLKAAVASVDQGKVTALGS